MSNIFFFKKYYINNIYNMGQTLSGFKKSEFLDTMKSNPMKIQVNEKSPEINEAEAPEINEAEVPEINEAEAPEINEAEAPEINESEAPEINESEAPETNEVAPLDENKAWPPPDIF